MEEYKLFDAEYRPIKLVWNPEPVNSTALTCQCETEPGWKKLMVFNLIRKLTGRGFLKSEHATTAVSVKREQVCQYKDAAAVKRGFGGFLPVFMVASLQGEKLSPQEADELRRMFDESEGGP